MKIVKSLEESDLLVKSVSQTTKISKSSLAAGHTWSRPVKSRVTLVFWLSKK